MAEAARNATSMCDEATASSGSRLPLHLGSRSVWQCWPGQQQGQQTGFSSNLQTGQLHRQTAPHASARICWDRQGGCPTKVAKVTSGTACWHCHAGSPLTSRAISTTEIITTTASKMLKASLRYSKNCSAKSFMAISMQKNPVKTMLPMFSTLAYVGDSPAGRHTPGLSFVEAQTAASAHRASESMEASDTCHASELAELTVIGHGKQNGVDDGQCQEEGGEPGVLHHLACLPASVKQVELPQWQVWVIRGSCGPALHRLGALMEQQTCLRHDRGVKEQAGSFGGAASQRKMPPP